MAGEQQPPRRRWPSGRSISSGRCRPSPCRLILRAQRRRALLATSRGRLLSPALTARLKNYCRRHDATMHQVLLAAFEALISRYTGQSEFLLGSTIANRTQPGMENVVGRFAHPQVILADVRGNPSYRRASRPGRRLERKILRAPGSCPSRASPRSSRSTRRAQPRSFCRSISSIRRPSCSRRLPGAAHQPRPSVSGGVNFDMLVSIVERNEGPRLQIEYNTVLFERERVPSACSINTPAFLKR